MSYFFCCHARQKEKNTFPTRRLFQSARLYSGTCPRQKCSSPASSQPRACSCSRNISRPMRSEEHTSELQSRLHLVCRLLLEKQKRRESSPVLRNLCRCSPT